MRCDGQRRAWSTSVARCGTVEEHGDIWAREECTYKPSAHLEWVFVSVKDVS